jgi:hypothetical protein
VYKPFICIHFQLKALFILQITDLPVLRPNGPIKPEEKERHVILSLKVPSSNSQLEDTVPLVQAVFGFIDWMESGKLNLRPEVSRPVGAVQLIYSMGPLNLDRSKVEYCQRRATQGSAKGSHGREGEGGKFDLIWIPYVSIP